MLELQMRSNSKTSDVRIKLTCLALSPGKSWLTSAEIVVSQICTDSSIQAWRGVARQSVSCKKQHILREFRSDTPALEHWSKSFVCWIYDALNTLVKITVC